MLNSIGKILLTGTAIAPVLFVFATIGFWSGDILIPFILIIVGSFLCISCWGLLLYARRKLECSQFRIMSAEAVDRENMGFILLYMMPLFTSSFENLNWFIWWPTIILIMLITATGYHYSFNPLLGLVGWHFYKVGTAEGITYVLLTKKQIRNVHGAFQTVQLTEYILMDVGEKK